MLGKVGNEIESRRDGTFRARALAAQVIPEGFVRRTAFAILLMFLLSGFAVAADSYQQGKIVKWENGTYAQNSKKKPMKNWIIYQLQTDTSTYSIARQKETKPQMQAGETVQYELKKDNRINVIDTNGKKHEYQIVGQTAGAGQ